MGLTKLTMDEIRNIDKTISQRRAKLVLASLMRGAGSFIATNNTPDGYRTNCTDR